MSLTQSIPLSSIRNARELGGYRTADGGTVKHDLLLRTGALNGISDEDIRMLEETYRLQHIIDFRMAMEMTNADDPVIGGAAYHHLDVIDPAAFAVEGMPEIDITKFDLVQMTQLTIQWGLLDENLYVGFLAGDFGRKAFAQFFRILLETDPDRAVLWHCTGGKDRTGLAAMLLLSALGADEETVMRDYLLTNTFNAQRIEGTKQYLKAKGCDDAFIEKAALVFDGVDGSFMRTAIAWLKKEYGSVVGYIRSGLNITQADINSLKEKYLVSK